MRGLSILLLFQRHDEKGSGRMALQHFVVQYILLLLSSWSDSCDTCAVWWQFDKINKEPPCALLAEPLISTKGGRSLTILGLQKSVREKKHFFPLLFEVNRTKVFSRIQSNSVLVFLVLFSEIRDRAQESLIKKPISDVPPEPLNIYTWQKVSEAMQMIDIKG